MVNERLGKIRELMRERGVDAYVVPTSDFHESEYVGRHFACREYMTGFTGSAGTAVITADEAGLWTDGRYFVQAAKELEGSMVELRRMGQEGVPTILEYLAETVPAHGTVGFDGRVINEQLGERIEECLADKEVSVVYQEDLVGMIWQDRPALSAEPIWVLEEEYGTGESNCPYPHVGR